MNDDEREERMARLMRGMGARSSRRAYIRAYPARAKLENIMHQMGDVGIDIGVPLDQFPHTIKQLYKRCPELKTPGVPPGYPMKGGPMEQRDFVHKMFYKCMAERLKPGQHEALVELEIGINRDEVAEARDGDDDVSRKTGAPAPGTEGPGTPEVHGESPKAL